MFLVRYCVCMTIVSMVKKKWRIAPEGLPVNSGGFEPAALVSDVHRATGNLNRSSRFLARNECTSSERVVWKKLSGLSIYKLGVINERHLQKLNGMHNIIAHMHRNHFHAIACRRMFAFHRTFAADTLPRLNNRPRVKTPGY